MRIIAGSARGCRLKAPKGLGTRPTADRIKESLFNILGRAVAGRRVLDLFAGTGSLGLEALSRGAASAVLIDQATARLLWENARHARLAERAEVLRGDVFSGMRRLEARGDSFGLVFCDPPYGHGLWERALAFLDASPILAREGIVIVEHGGQEDAPPTLSALERVGNRRYGRTTQLSIFRKMNDSMYQEVDLA